MAKQRVWVRGYTRKGYTVRVPDKVISGHWREIDPGKIRIKSASIAHKKGDFALVKVTNSQGKSDMITVRLRSKATGDKTTAQIIAEAKRVYLSTL